MFAPLVLTFVLLFQAPPQGYWSWHETFEWEIQFWQWESDKDDLHAIPKNSRPVASVKIYKEMGAKAYTSTTVNDLTVRVAASPKGIEREAGLVTYIEVSVVRAKDDGELIRSHAAGTTSYSADLKFGEREFFAGNSRRGAKGKRAIEAFTLTIRRCNKDFEQLLRDDFPNEALQLLHNDQPRKKAKQ